MALFVALVGLGVRALVAPSIGAAECAPVICVLMLLGLSDCTIWLAARSEVYMYMAVCFMLGAGTAVTTAAAAAAAGGGGGGDMTGNMTGSVADPDRHMWTAVKIVQLGIWIWACVSKWGEWFPFVVQVKVCNSIVWHFTRQDLHRALFRNHPTDLRASSLCWYLAHFGTVTEMLFPLMLALGGDSGTAGTTAGATAGIVDTVGTGYLAHGGSVVGRVGLFIAIGFHAFIFIQIAAGAPQEWNLFTVINAVFLFGLRGGLAWDDVTAMAAAAPLLAAFLFVVEVVIPCIGHVSSKHVSFLPAMRYYAGNWPVSVFLVKRTAYHRLANLKTVTGTIHDQVRCSAVRAVRAVRCGV